MKPRMVTRVRLLPAQWVRLPGTTWEVYLHGKRYGSSSEGVDVIRDGAQPEFGGWNLDPVWAHIYLRQVRQ